MGMEIIEDNFIYFGKYYSYYVCKVKVICYNRDEQISFLNNYKNVYVILIKLFRYYTVDKIETVELLQSTLKPYVSSD